MNFFCSLITILNLGETYECVREDRGFRYVSEQVSHHPPVSTCHAFAEDGSWTWSQDFRVKTKFWGKVTFITAFKTSNLEFNNFSKVFIQTLTTEILLVHGISTGRKGLS